MTFPIVLILSEGKVTPTEIINNIRKIDQSQDNILINATNSLDFVGFKYNVTTKYYKTTVLLVPAETDIKLLPLDVVESVEALFVYFDPGNRGFTKRLPIYAEFIRQNNIELGILLCDRLYDDSNEGITYKEAKQESNLLLDIIELDRSRGDDEEDDSNDPVGYEELKLTLRSFMWSNVDVTAGINNPFIRLNGVSASRTSESVVLSDEESDDCSSVEAQLEIFEKLLKQVQTFKNETASWERSQVYSHAEKLAEQFSQIMSDELDGEEV